MCWPRTRGERLPGVFLKSANVASMESLPSTACFAQTTFSICAAVLEKTRTKSGGCGLILAPFTTGRRDNV